MNKIEFKEITIAYITSSIPETIHQEMLEMEAVMYNNEGGAIYNLRELSSRFDPDSDEFKMLNSILSKEIEYIEYS